MGYKKDQFLQLLSIEYIIVKLHNFKKSAIFAVVEYNLVLGGNLKIYTGNGHTTTRTSAAMALLSYKVIAAGRITHEPKLLSKHKIKQVKNYIYLLNKIGKMLRTDEDLGRRS